MAKAKEISVEDKLKALYKLQLIDTKIDKIKIVRGELPLEVQDLADEIAGLQTRIDKVNDEVAELEKGVSDKKNLIIESEASIVKYKEQQNNVRNNREFDSLTKEIEFQELEIELANKRVKEAKAKVQHKKDSLTDSLEKIEIRKEDHTVKQNELDNIVSETEKEEETLGKLSVKAEGTIEERLVVAYKRVRGSVRNGLAVVSVERESCGGCFNKIPPQRQLDIRIRKKVLVCEHCGRILVDPELAEEVADKL
jgi:predicted  nucleic acid-binding Zn-ribbon protein